MMMTIMGVKMMMVAMVKKSDWKRFVTTCNFKWIKIRMMMRRMMMKMVKMVMMMTIMGMKTKMVMVKGIGNTLL